MQSIPFGSSTVVHPSTVRSWLTPRNGGTVDGPQTNGDDAASFSEDLVGVSRTAAPLSRSPLLSAGMDVSGTSEHTWSDEKRYLTRSFGAWLQEKAWQGVPRHVSVMALSHKFSCPDIVRYMATHGEDSIGGYAQEGMLALGAMRAFSELHPANLELQQKLKNVATRFSDYILKHEQVGLRKNGKISLVLGKNNAEINACALEIIEKYGPNSLRDFISSAYQPFFAALQERRPDLELSYQSKGIQSVETLSDVRWRDALNPSSAGRDIAHATGCGFGGWILQQIEVVNYVNIKAREQTPTPTSHEYANAASGTDDPGTLPTLPSPPGTPAGSIRHSAANETDVPGDRFMPPAAFTPGSSDEVDSAHPGVRPQLGVARTLADRLPIQNIYVINNYVNAAANYGSGNITYTISPQASGDANAYRLVSSQTFKGPGVNEMPEGLPTMHFEINHARSGEPLRRADASSNDLRGDPRFVINHADVEDLPSQYASPGVDPEQTVRKPLYPAEDSAQPNLKFQYSPSTGQTPLAEDDQGVFSMSPDVPTSDLRHQNPFRFDDRRGSDSSLASDNSSDVDSVWPPEDHQTLMRRFSASSQGLVDTRAERMRDPMGPLESMPIPLLDTRVKRQLSVDSPLLNRADQDTDDDGRAQPTEESPAVLRRAPTRLPLSLRIVPTSKELDIQSPASEATVAPPWITYNHSPPLRLSPHFDVLKQQEAQQARAAFTRRRESNDSLTGVSSFDASMQARKSLAEVLKHGLKKTSAQELAKAALYLRPEIFLRSALETALGRGKDALYAKNVIPRGASEQYTTTMDSLTRDQHGTLDFETESGKEMLHALRELADDSELVSIGQKICGQLGAFATGPYQPLYEAMSPWHPSPVEMRAESGRVTTSMGAARSVGSRMSFVPGEIPAARQISVN